MEFSNSMFTEELLVKVFCVSPIVTPLKKIHESNRFSAKYFSSQLKTPQSGVDD